MRGLFWMILICVTLTAGGVLVGQGSAWGYVLMVPGASALGWIAAGYDTLIRQCRR